MTATPSSVPGLGSVLCTEELDRRPSRPPDYERESRALAALAQSLANSPVTILQTLADTILSTCQCDSAGISLVTEDGEKFRWPAIAGVWKAHIGSGTPRDFSPCGDVLDLDRPLLFSRFQRRYTYFQAVSPQVDEALFVPFYINGKSVGTIWAVMHEGRPGTHVFDREDLRLLESMSMFASAGHQTVEQTGAHKQQDRERDEASVVLRELNGALLCSSIRQHELVEEVQNAAAALRESEDRFRAVADNMDQLAWTCDSLGNVTWYNQRWLDYTGMAFDDMKGWDWSKVQHPDHLARVVSRVERSVLTGEPWEETFPLRGKDGEYRWFLSRSVPIRDGDGNILQWFGTNTDITERRAAAAKVQTSETRFRRLFESSKDGILLMDAMTGKILDANPFIEELLSTSRDLLVGRELWEIGLLHDRDDARRVFRQLQETGCLRYEDLPLETPEGGLREVELVCSVYAEGDASVVQCNIRDITERKRLAVDRDRLIESEREAHRTSEKANRAKDVFLATLSHELRTPLSAILGWSVMLRKAGKYGLEDVAEGLAVIERNARAQGKLIEDVLDITRIESGKLVLDAQPCDLAALASAAVDSLRPALDAKKLTLEFGGSGHDPLEPVWILGDASRLQQVLWNLLTNAVKFTPKGGRVGVGIKRQGADAVVTVTDSGVGIPEQFLPHVFDRFKQADEGTTRAYGGLGLGLSIVRQIVEMHGGSAEARSGGEGLGSVFTIRLPLIEGRAYEAPAQAVADLTALCGLRVLVVDDAPDARVVATIALESAGATVAGAGSALEGFRLITTADPPFDLLVCDIGMPQEDGYSLLRRLRAAGFDAKALPAVALTAFASPEDRRLALQGGFQMHISKPADPFDLVAGIAGLVQGGG